jgi:hypothetical protein
MNYSIVKEGESFAMQLRLCLEGGHYINMERIPLKARNFEMAYEEAEHIEAMKDMPVDPQITDADMDDMFQFFNPGAKV